jgi:hypothetical protein
MKNHPHDSEKTLDLFIWQDIPVAVLQREYVWHRQIPAFVVEYSVLFDAEGGGFVLSQMAANGLAEAHRIDCVTGSLKLGIQCNRGDPNVNNFLEKSSGRRFMFGTHPLAKWQANEGYSEERRTRASAVGRQEFERHMEVRRLEEADEGELKPLRRGWCLGSEQFRQEMLERMDGKLGENHSGELHRETAEQKANRILSEELSRWGWTESDLAARRRSDPDRLAIAVRLRNETTLPVKWIAARGFSFPIRSRLTFSHPLRSQATLVPRSASPAPLWLTDLGPGQPGNRSRRRARRPGSSSNGTLTGSP